MNEPQSVTVSALTEQIRNLLEPRFFGISVRGEISNFKKHSSGHLYFTLKDAKAQIGAVMFAASAGRLRAVPKDGDQVLVTGNLNVYPPHGKYQIVVEEMTPLGLGELLMKLEQLKLEIKRRGWFEKEHKKPLPPFPKRIGIVTSPTGAAIQDILNVLSRRFAGVEILLNPVRVQGETAAAEIAQAIEQFNKYQLADVLIVGRGGGSLEDLFAFNEEIVARAVFESAIPIICAVGHETDHCIAEYVADMRAPTPSAAAELVIREKGEILERLKNQKSQLAALLLRKLQQERKVLSLLAANRFLQSPYTLLGTHLQRLDTLREGIDSTLLHRLKRTKTQLLGLSTSVKMANPALRVKNTKARLTELGRTLFHQFSHLVQRKRKTVQSLDDTLRAIDPKHLLSRGYSILLSDKDGSVINSLNKLQKSQTVKILLSDGSAKARIEELIHDEAKKL